MDINHLKKARESIKLTQSQAAQTLKISDGTYKNYEQGKREPNGDMIVRLADLYHVTTDYLLGRNSNESDPLDQLNLLPEDRAFISAYLELDVKERESLLATLRKLLQIKKAEISEIKAKETTV